jgi:microcystin-dependent protein
MADQFLAEIRVFPFNFAPTGWALCNGQILSISQFSALFSLLGTQFGGNGTSNFGLPNLQGAAPVDQGQGAGLSAYVVGQSGGAPSVQLTAAQNAIHSHALTADNEVSTSASPSGAIYMRGHYAAGNNSGQVMAYTKQPPNTAMSASALTPAGAGLPHNNLMPYLTLNFCIALTGIYPTRG